MKKIAILTASFPYLPGEQFLEDEIFYWGKRSCSDVDVFLLPFSVSGSPRSIPDGIKIDLSMSQKRTLIDKMHYAIRAFFCKDLYRELVYLCSLKKLTPRTFFEALRSVAITLCAQKGLNLFFSRHGVIDVSYCYWNGAQAYASILNKRSGKIKKVISRAHGFDLYEERRLKSYMPLKRNFIKELDAVYAICQQGKDYMEYVYKMHPEKVLVSRLGVPLPCGLAQPSSDGCLNVVSVSFCVPVKRIDKIIKALSYVSNWRKNLKIKWTHIGDGPLLPDLKLLAQEVFFEKNIKFNFLGSLPNSQVRSFFLNEPTDLFLNSSEAEGIPVSIMEAMACGIPAIAPDVGGISELIPLEFETMLPGKFEPKELALLIDKTLLKSKDGIFRSAFKKEIKSKFNADVNYMEFVGDIYGYLGHLSKNSSNWQG